MENHHYYDYCRKQLNYYSHYIKPPCIKTVANITIVSTLWLFNIAIENGSFIDNFPINTSIYKGFSMVMLNNQMVFMEIHGVSHSVTKQSWSRMREELEMVFPAETLEGMEKRQELSAGTGRFLNET